MTRWPRSAMACGSAPMTSPRPPVLLQGATSADTNTMSSGLVVAGGGLRAAHRIRVSTQESGSTVGQLLRVLVAHSHGNWLASCDSGSCSEVKSTVQETQSKSCTWGCFMANGRWPCFFHNQLQVRLITADKQTLHPAMRLHAAQLYAADCCCCACGTRPWDMWATSPQAACAHAHAQSSPIQYCNQSIPLLAGIVDIQPEGGRIQFDSGVRIELPLTHL